MRTSCPGQFAVWEPTLPADAWLRWTRTLQNQHGAGSKPGRTWLTRGVGCFGLRLMALWKKALREKGQLRDRHPAKEIFGSGSTATESPTQNLKIQIQVQFLLGEVRVRKKSMVQTGFWLSSTPCKIIWATQEQGRRRKGMFWSKDTVEVGSRMKINEGSGSAQRDSAP